VTVVHSKFKMRNSTLAFKGPERFSMDGAEAGEGATRSILL